MRIRRGFGRIAVVGALIGIVVAIASLVTAAVLYTFHPAKPDSYENSQRHPMYGLTQADRAKFLSDGYIPDFKSGFLVKKGVEAIAWDEASRENQDNIVTAICVAAGAVAVALVWAALFQGLGWTIAGFSNHED